MSKTSERPEGQTDGYEPPKVEEVATEADPAITAAGVSLTDGG